MRAHTHTHTNTHAHTQCSMTSDYPQLRKLWASLGAQRVKNLPAMQKTWVNLLSQEDLWRRKWNPLQYSCLESPMDTAAWQATVWDSWGPKEPDMTEGLTLSLSKYVLETS